MKSLLFCVGGDKGWAIANRGKNLAAYLEKYFDITIHNEWPIPKDIHDYDIVHMHRPICHADVFSYTDIWGFEIPSMRILQMARELDLFAQADFVIAKNSEMSDLIEPMCKEGCFQYIIPNGVDCSIFKPKVFRIGWVGNDVYPASRASIKRTFLIEQACKLLNKELDGLASVEFVKDASAYPDQILSPKEIAEFYRSLDVFVLASVSEGSSNVILEALATGIPVVTTKVGNWQFLFKKGLIATATGTAESIKNGIKNALDDQLYSRQIILEYFSWEKIAEHYVNLYKSLGVI